MTSRFESPLRRFALLVLLFAAACQGAPEKKSTFRYVAPSDAEAEAYAASFELALENRNTARLSRLIGWDYMIDKATAGVEAPRRFREGFVKGAREGTKTAAFAQQVIANVENGGRVDRLRIRTVDGEKRLILRLLMVDGGVNYHELTLHRDPSGFVQASDIYIYVSAEALSETFARMYKLAAADAQPRRVLARLIKGDSATTLTKEDFRRFKEMGEAAAKGEHDRAIDLYRALPAQLRKEKSAMVMLISSSSSKGDEVYEKALDEFHAAYPNERGLDLMLVDTYLLRKQYADAIAAIDRVDAALGGDPYLDALRANVHLTAGDTEKAKLAASRAIVRDAQLEAPYWTLITIALAADDHRETARLLQAVEDEAGIEVGDLTEVPDYVRFVRTPEYAELMRR